jgi:hypothetical protein
LGRGHLQRRFPKVKILSGPAEVSQAFEVCDFLLHGSGPYLVAPGDVERWRTARPAATPSGLDFHQLASIERFHLLMI